MYFCQLLFLYFEVLFSGAYVFMTYSYFSFAFNFLLADTRFVMSAMFISYLPEIYFLLFQHFYILLLCLNLLDLLENTI